MSTYTPANISAGDIDEARRALRPTPPNTPPRPPAATAKPMARARLDLEFVPVLLCVARVARVAGPRHALELVLLAAGARPGSSAPALALPCVATALYAATRGAARLESLRSAAIVTAARAAAPAAPLLAALAACIALVEAPRSLGWCVLAALLQDAAQLRLARRVSASPARRGELELAAQLGALAGVHVAMDLWRGTAPAPQLAARALPLAAWAALLRTPANDDEAAFLETVFDKGTRGALARRCAGYYGSAALVTLGATSQEPLAALVRFVAPRRRLGHVAYWALCVGGGVRAALRSTLPPIERRKLFHVLVLVLFAPARDGALLGVAFGGAAFLMVAAEEARARRLVRLDALYDRFLDGRDGRVALTHVYLLLGCALPHWLHLMLKADGADCLVLRLGGVAVLGAGDAAACVVGRRCGASRWPASTKTYVGSLAFVVATRAFFCFFNPIYVRGWELALAAVLVAFLEATVASVDNLVLPLYFSALALCAVAVDRASPYPLAELLHDL